MGQEAAKKVERLRRPVYEVTEVQGRALEATVVLDRPTKVLQLASKVLVAPDLMLSELVMVHVKDQQQDQRAEPGSV